MIMRYWYDRVHNCPNENVWALNGELEPSSKGVPLSHTHSLFAHHSITNLVHTLLSSIANVRAKREAIRRLLRR